MPAVETPKLRSDRSLRLLTRSDLKDIELEPSKVIELVEDGYRALDEGQSRCPTKMMIDLPVKSRDSIAFSMLGFDGYRDLVGYKTSYRKGGDNLNHYYTTITVYDDSTGLPYVLMDCQKVGALRTPATTALIARQCSKPDPQSVLMLGTGIQAVNTLPYLATALPSLSTFTFHGTHEGGIRSTREHFRRWYPDLDLRFAEDIKEAVQESDIVVVASGRACHPPIHTDWLPKGGLLISVASKGVADGAVAEADRVVATSEGQYALVGKRLCQGSNQLDGVLPELTSSDRTIRSHADEKVFAFSSGMIVTDIPVADELAMRALAAGRGQEIQLWD